MMTSSTSNQGSRNQEPYLQVPLNLNTSNIANLSSAPRSRNNSFSSRGLTPTIPSPLRHLSPHVRRSILNNSNNGSSSVRSATVPVPIPLTSPLSRTSSMDVPTPISTPTTSLITPFLPNLAEICPQPTSPNPTAEAALEAERARIKERESEEIGYDASQLRLSLKRERAHSLRLTSDLVTLKLLSVKSQAEAEAHEEGLINGLLRRLECLQREKGRIIVELEREEEMLTNTLQKKLNEVRKEKALLQKQIEREHSSNTNLKTQLNSNVSNDVTMATNDSLDTFVQAGNHIR